MTIRSSLNRDVDGLAMVGGGRVPQMKHSCSGVAWFCRLILKRIKNISVCLVKYELVSTILLVRSYVGNANVVKRQGTREVSQPNLVAVFFAGRSVSRQ